MKTKKNKTKRLSKTTILSRLHRTVKMLLTLQPEEFNYGDWVTNYSRKDKCGTVCCVAGWYPKYFPESGIRWTRGGEITRGIDVKLTQWHGLDEKVIDFLFRGGSLRVDFEGFHSQHGNNEVIVSDKHIWVNAITVLSRVTLNEVILRFQIIIAFVESGIITKGVINQKESKDFDKVLSIIKDNIH